MRRKEFFKTAALGCLACGGMLLPAEAEGRSQSDAQTSEAEAKAREHAKRFKQAYLLALMENMEKQLDENTRRALMESCGRACARRGGLLKTAEACRGDVQKFVAAFAKLVGPELAFVEGETVHWGYPRCFCELVADGPERLPETYCRCSVGWVKEMFETVMGKPVRVDLVQSVKSGASSCRFLIHI
ncbi:MAG: hypothetical protein FJY83_10420 [Candidatus Aminicenantes bacterium]|nr:hypothetical protein [Candidatus Aminicenantes bacterium]